MLFLQFIGEQHRGLPDGLWQSVKEGKLGKTPQFWVNYLDLFEIRT